MEAAMLFQNEPNPVVRSTSISFKLAARSYATLKIYDIGKRLVDTLVDEELSAGLWSFDWARGTVGPGVYLYELNFDGDSLIKEMLLE